MNNFINYYKHNKTPIVYIIKEITYAIDNNGTHFIMFFRIWAGAAITNDIDIMVKAKTYDELYFNAYVEIEKLNKKV